MGKKLSLMLHVLLHVVCKWRLSGLMTEQLGVSAARGFHSLLRDSSAQHGAWRPPWRRAAKRGRAALSALGFFLGTLSCLRVWFFLKS